MLDAKLKQLKKSGKENIKHKPAIAAEDLMKLKASKVLECSNPLGLLRNVWFNTSLYWCRRGREGQRGLTKSSFKFMTDENNKPYVQMAHDEVTKNHQGGVNDQETYEKDGRMYKDEDDPNCGYDALKLYLSKRNPHCEAFYQYPKRKWSAFSEPVWYENRCLGINTLSDMMKNISSAAALSTIYTNHSVRVTAITLWSNAGLTNRHIMAISGHKNEASLLPYNSRPSSSQLRQCSDIITNALVPKEKEPNKELLVTATSSEVKEELLSGFSLKDCTISTLNIKLTVNKK